MANELRAKLVIESEAEGSEAIIKLRGEVDKLGDSAELAGPEFEALAQEVAKLGQQQAAISQFERLKQSVGDLAKRTQELQTATREAALALKVKQAAMAEATNAQQASNAQLAQARKQQEDLRVTISTLEKDLKSLATAAKASGDNSAHMAEQLKDGQMQLAVLKRESQGAAANLSALAAANRENTQATTSAAREVAAAQKQFELLRQATKHSQTTLDGQNISLQRSRDELGKLGVSSSALAKSQIEMNQGLERSRGALQRLAQEAQQAATVLADRELLGVRAHADIQKEIDETRAAFDRLKASGKLTQTELAQAALKSEERIRDLKHETNGWVDSLGKAKVAMGAMVASGAGLAAVINKAVEFESAMADVSKVVDGTDQQMAKLTSRIKQMTATIPMAASELAQIAAAGGQLGIPIEKLEQFIELAAQMATAFNMSAEQAGQAVAKLSNIFGLPLEKVRALGDAINVLGNTTAAREADIVEVLTRIGGSARQFGLTAEQAAALGTAMLSLGVSAEVAGTGINAILSKLQTANIQGKDFQEALAEVGVSAKQLGEDIRANPQKALDEFLQTLSKLDGAKQTEVLSRLFGTEYQDDVARLLAGLDGYQRALQSVGSAAATAGAMHKEFETRVATSEAQIKLLKNGVETLATNLGSVFLPVLKVVVGGLADASHAVARLAEQFPVLAGAATLLTVLAVGATGAKTAYLALSVVAAKVSAGLSSAATAAGIATAANGALAKSADSASLANDKLAKSADAAKVQMTALGVAGRIGLGLAAADGVVNIVKLGGAIVDLMRAREKLSQSQAQGAEIDRQMADRLRDISASTGVLVNSYDELMDAQKRGLIAQDEATGKWLAAADAQIKLAPVIQKTAEALAKQQAELARTDAGVLVTEFEKAAAGADKLDGAIKALAESLKFGDVQGVSAFSLALDELASKGKLTATQVGDAWQQALAKLSVGEIGALRANLEEAGRQGVLTAEQVARANDQILSASFERVGVNAAQAMGQISKGAQQAIDGIGLVAEAAKAAGASTEQAARSIEMAFAAAIPKADSLEAIKALEEKLKAMGKAGEISAQGMERVQAALDKQKASIEGQIPGIQSLQEALRELGVKPQAELDALAKKAKAAFDVIKASGTATPREVSEAWKAMAEASIAANNGVADAVLQAQASQQGFVIETDKAGKAIVKSMQEAAEATKDVGDAAKAAGEAAAEGAAAATEATDRFARDASGQVLKLEGTWLDAEAAASKYSAQVAELVYSLNKPLELMRQEHLAMVRSLEALDAAQQRLQSNGASSVDDLRLRLLELNGTEEQIAEARQRREIAEVERNKRLMEIQLKRARMLGNEEDVAAAEFELQMLNEQLKLLEQIHKEEDKQRDAKAREAKRQQEEREREERERASRDASGGSSGSSSTSAVDNSRGPVTFAPTLNVHGITDPVLLARQMAPMLEKMARLSR